MTTLRCWASHPARRWVAAVVLLAAGFGGLTAALLASTWMGSPEQTGRWLSAWMVAGIGLAGLCVQLSLTVPRPAPAPRRRRHTPRHAKRRGFGASALFQGLRGGRAPQTAPGVIELRGGDMPGAPPLPAASTDVPISTRSVDAAGTKQPAAPTEHTTSPGRGVPPADRTMRLPVYRVGRAPVGGVR